MSVSLWFPRVYLLARLVTGFGGMSCYLMSWLLVVEILKKGSVSGCGCGRVTYFSLAANFLSIAFALGETSSK